jgi:hypothetical protein
MNPQLLDKKRGGTPTSPKGDPSAPGSNRPEQQPQEPDGHEAGGITGVGRGRGRTAPDRPPAFERRRRSEALARSMAAATDLDELVAIIKEHGRAAVSRAAAVRPDLMPEINGEFAHIALSLADLD